MTGSLVQILFDIAFKLQILSLNGVIFSISEKTVPTSSDKEVIEANLTPNGPNIAFQKAKVFYRMLPFTT